MDFIVDTSNAIDDLYARVNNATEGHSIAGRLLMLPVIAIHTLSIPLSLGAQAVYELAMTIYETALYFFNHNLNHKEDALTHLKDFAIAGSLCVVSVPFMPIFAIMRVAYNIVDPKLLTN